MATRSSGRSNKGKGAVRLVEEEEEEVDQHLSEASSASSAAPARDPTDTGPASPPTAAANITPAVAEEGPPPAAASTEEASTPPAEPSPPTEAPAAELPPSEAASSASLVVEENAPATVANNEEASTPPAEPSPPVDLVQVLRLQQEVLAQQLASLDTIVRQHTALSGGANPLVKVPGSSTPKSHPPETGEEYAPRMVHPSRDEIVLVHMLDAQGGLLTRAHVAELLTLMSRTKGVARKATIITVLRRSFKTKILEYFVATGGLGELTGWLNEFVAAGDAEAIQLTLKLLMELPAGPDLGLKIKESGLAKVVQKMRKQELPQLAAARRPSSDTSASSTPPSPAAMVKEMADDVAVTWKVLVKGARRRPAPPPSASSSSSSTAPGAGARSGKQKLGSALSSATATGDRVAKRPRKEFGAINAKANAVSSDGNESSRRNLASGTSRKAEVDREREVRIAGRKHNPKARSNLASMDTTAIKNKTAEAKRQRQERIQEQRRIRQEQAQKAEEARQKKQEDARQKEILRQEQKQRAQMERIARMSDGGGGGMGAATDKIIFSKMSHMDEDDRAKDNAGDTNSGGDYGDESASGRRIRWGDQVEGKALYEIREFVSKRPIDGDGDGDNDGDAADEDAVSWGGGGSMSERRKKEQEKERAMMEAARGERAAKRSELWESIDSFAPSQTRKVVPARLQAAGSQIDAFESIEVPVQEQRESAILEVFVSREGEGGPADPAVFFGHEEGQGGAAKFIPLYSTKDFQVTARPMLRDIIMDDERSGDFESANLTAGPVSEDAVAVARSMLKYMNEDQKRELRTVFPADLPTSSTLRFDQFWASAEEIAVESIQDELPAAFQDLPPAVITWLANNPDVVVELIDNDTGEIDPEKLKITVEGLYANNLVPRPTMQMQADAPPMAAVPVLSVLPLPNSGAMGGPAPAQDPHAVYAERMRQLNNMGRGRGMGAPMGVVGPPPMGMPPNMQQQAQAQMGVMGANGSVNGVPADKLIAAVKVQFKRGRQELFRVDDPVLAAQCAGFNGPYYIWIECNSNGNPGKDVGQVVEQMGRNRAGDTFQMRRALSVATQDDVAGFAAKHQAEQEALQMAINLSRDMGLPMTIDDAEWQFDKKKLTMFYSAGGRVDFRDFVKKMGSHNKTFLWMVRSEGKTPPNNPAMHQSRPGAPGGMPGGMMGMGSTPMGGGGIMSMGRGMPMGSGPPMGGPPPMGMGMPMPMPMHMQMPGQQMGTLYGGRGPGSGPGSMPPGPV